MPANTLKGGTKPPVNAGGSRSPYKQASRKTYQEILTARVRNRGPKIHAIPLAGDFDGLCRAFVEEYGHPPEQAFWLYARVSTTGQDSDRSGLEDQIKETAHALAQAHSAIVTEIYLDVASGLTVDRPGLQAMVQAAEAAEAAEGAGP